MKLAALSLLAFAAVAHAQYAGSAPIPATYRKGTDSITIADAKAYLGFLAGPECEGRGTLQPGYLKAANFVAAHFKEYGLQPVGDHGTYFQMVHFARTSLRAADSALESVDGKKVYAGAGEIAFGSLSQNADVTGGAVFLRFAGNDVKIPTGLGGKVVFVVTPSFRFTVRNAILDQKPLAIVAVTDTVIQGQGRSLRPVSKNLSRISITPKAAAMLASDLGVPADFLDASKAEEGKVERRDATGEVRLVAKFDEKESQDVPNVVGYLPGSDPKLNNELVGIGAHLDHLGKNGNGVYPGADDDGSGSTALIGVIKAFHDGGIKPRRGILFMNFCGEEMGLLGSGWYSDHPIFPHSQMIAELQMDMVGRDSDGVQNGDQNRVDKKEENIDTMRLVGSKRISTDLHNLILKDNQYINFKFKWDAEDVYTRSDHYNFAKVGIPIAFLFDGFHPDYHQTTDTIEKIDWAKLTNAAKLYYIVAADLANTAQRPRHDVPQTGGDE